MTVSCICAISTLLLWFASSDVLHLASASTVGHLQPLGAHRPPDIAIDEYEQAISGNDFFTKYVSQQKPVVFRDSAKQWPAFRKWTDETMSSKYGREEVKIEPKIDGTDRGAIGTLGMGRDTIENFIAEYSKQNKYVVSELPSAMYNDVLVHPVLTCGELNQSLVEIDLWLSSGGTRSRLHRDAFNAINCVVNGTKDWIMIDNNQTEDVYFVPSGRYEMGGLSPIDVERVDLDEFSRFRRVRYGRVSVHAGDCLFIPGG